MIILNLDEGKEALLKSLADAGMLPRDEYIDYFIYLGAAVMAQNIFHRITETHPAAAPVMGNISAFFYEQCNKILEAVIEAHTETDD
jgi:hypothetical protein